MANEDVVLKEVDQELAEERQWAMFRKHGPAIISAAVAVVAGVAAWQFWSARQNAVAERQALEFRNAVELLAEDRDAGRAALNATAEEGGGYGVLARLHRAASYAGAGERLNAIESYRDVYNDGSVLKRVREFARLRAAYLSLADGRDAVLADLGDLADSDGAYGVYARELYALAALSAKDYETALAMFRQLSIDISAPQTLRSRAEDFAALAASGKAGVNITGEARVEDLIEAVGEDPNVAGEDASTDAGGDPNDASEATEEEQSVSETVPDESEVE